MDSINIAAFIFVATLLVISPGPNGVLVAKTVPLSGRRAGFANVWGFVAAFYVHGTLSVLGISVLLVQSAQAFFVFKMLGAAYLCWIGFRALMSAWRPKANCSKLSPVEEKNLVSIRTAFFEGLLTNVLNPKVSMFYLAAFPQFLPVEDSASSAYILISAHAAVNLLWFSAMVILISQLKTLSISHKVSKWLKSSAGFIFIGFGAKLGLSQP
ncbi:LysE family translocator [Microbulbifer epialgicus]|uniref:LysE family translocator n=1 Tax=Microbulbifer epialgicus TaxID=393907 RepID=A0ABV4P2D2_9GAMM